MVDGGGSGPLTLLASALDLAGRGWPVLALHNPVAGRCSCSAGAGCPSPAKHPRTPHGLKDASTDAVQIAACWTRWPEANIGLLTGGTSPDVLDIDGAEADIELRRVHSRGGHLIGPGPLVSTGRGWHAYFRPTGHRNKVGLVEHADWRGAGGYVVAPPSRHISGRTYTWEPGCGPDEPLEPVPPWLIALLEPPEPPEAPAAPAWSGALAAGRSTYGQRALEAEVGRLALAPVGGRNDALNRAAFNLGQLVGGGELEPHEVAAALLGLAQRIGLGDHEAVATITSGMGRGVGLPRRRPA